MNIVHILYFLKFKDQQLNGFILLQFQEYGKDYNNNNKLYLSHFGGSTKPIYRLILSDLFYYEKGYLNKEDM